MTDEQNSQEMLVDYTYTVNIEFTVEPEGFIPRLMILQLFASEIM